MISEIKESLPVLLIDSNWWCKQETKKNTQYSTCWIDVYRFHSHHSRFVKKLTMQSTSSQLIIKQDQYERKWKDGKAKTTYNTLKSTIFRKQRNTKNHKNRSSQVVRQTISYSSESF